MCVCVCTCTCVSVGGELGWGVDVSVLDPKKLQGGL
jgi:hypothetical protein